jgi:hypothetical protein
MQIVDTFPFFAPYNKELLKLRINLYKDIVDKFVIVEANKTHSGQPVPFQFLECAEEFDLPMDKIIYIPLHINDSKWLKPVPMDFHNSGGNGEDEKTLLAVIRERTHRDALMQALYMFDDDTVFINSDADEIINPIHIRWVAETTKRLDSSAPNVLIKVPLVYLQGRADLRVWDISRGEKGDWYPWASSAYLATKRKVATFGFTKIRAGHSGMVPQAPHSHGNPIPDMGWHFSWMGDGKTRRLKAKSFCHAHGEWNGRTYGDKSYQDWLEKTEPAAGKPAPSGEPNHFLKSYPHDQLPDLIFEDETIRDFLLPYQPEII